MPALLLQFWMGKEMTGYQDEDESPDEVTWPAEKALSACPFCQGAVQFRKALHICDGNTDAIIHAAPTNCGMAQFEDGSTDESIIAKWNTRSVNAVPDLIAALEPFAALAELAAEEHKDSRPLIYGFDSALSSRLTIGHLRAAHAAIASVKP